MATNKSPKAKKPIAAKKRRAKRKANANSGKNDKWEVELLRQLSSRPIPVPAREFKFDPDRRWKFDFAWPSPKLAVEVEGGIYMGGRHVNPVGFTKDCEKYNTANEQGWVVLRYVPEHVKSGYAVEQINSVYKLLVTKMEVIQYGEEVLFGGDETDRLRAEVFERLSAKRTRAILAGLLVRSFDHGGGNPVELSEDDSD